MKLSCFLRALAWHLAGPVKYWADFPGFHAMSDWEDPEYYFTDDLFYPSFTIPWDEPRKDISFWRDCVMIYDESRSSHVVIEDNTRPVRVEIIYAAGIPKKEVYFDTFAEAFAAFF